MATDGVNLYLGGAFTKVNATSRAHLAAVDQTGALLSFKAATNERSWRSTSSARRCMSAARSSRCAASPAHISPP